ncbi:Vacuolar protein sorting-associated protein 13B, partial [Stegodyphus mimosarum]
MSPIWGIAESEEEQEKESNRIKAKRILQFGLYIGKSSCILKRTVLSQDTPSCCGSPKCVFLPLMVLHLYGCSMEFTSRGKDFVNVQTGVSGATITGLEDCVCGFPDFSSPQYEMKKIFLKSGVPPGSGHAYSFLSSSLFDPLAPENCNQSRKYCFDREEHLALLTEEVLVERFPAFAFDYLYEVEVPDEFIDRLSTVTTTFLEESNWHESSTCRLVFGPLCLDITSSLIHRLSKLIFSAKDCEYPNYYQPRKISTKPVNITDEDIKQLEEFVSVRQYH